VVLKDLADGLFDSNGPGAARLGDGWKFRKPLYVDHTKVAGPLKDFPLTVDLTRDADLAPNAKPDLADVRFTDADGRVLSHQIETVGGQQVWHDGQWCWFSGPRVVCHRGARSRVYGSYVSKRGDVGVWALDVDDGSVDHFVLHSSFEADDHDVPGLLVLPDGRLMAFYAKHAPGDPILRFRKTLHPEDITSWGHEQTHRTTVGGNVTYPTPVRLSAEGDRIYVFYRQGADRAVITSDDEGATWSQPTVLLHVPIKRPYWNVVDNGEDRVDIICTDGGNGGNELNDCSLFHFYITGGRVHRTDGTQVGRLSDLTSKGLRYSRLSKIYDVKENGAAWGWDLCLEPGTGFPVCVFAVFPTATPANSDHRLYYGRWNGSSWDHHEITPAGRWIDSDALETRYSGGIALNAEDPSVVYLSRQRGPNPQGNPVFELEIWKTRDKGRSWSKVRAITQGSTDKNVRPVYPLRRRTMPRDRTPEVIWTQGRYTGFTQFDTRQLFYPPLQRPGVLARVRAPKLSSKKDTTLWMYYGNPAAPATGGYPFDTNVILRYANLNRIFTGDPLDFASKDAVNLRGLTALTVRARVLLRASDDAGDVPASNFSGFRSKADELIRVQPTGSVDAFLITQPNKQFGGTFPRTGGVPDLHDGQWHDLVLAYDTVQGLRMYIDGVRSPSAFTGGGPLDADAQDGDFFIGAPAVGSPPGTRSLIGRVEDVSISNVRRSEEWIKTQAHDRADLVQLGQAV
jgi:BNR repeat-containing family member/Concanavalin A-like lectin/glucanases superfamily